MVRFATQPVGNWKGNLLTYSVRTTYNDRIVFCREQDMRGGSPDSHTLHRQETHLAIIDLNPILVVPITYNDDTTII